MNNQENSLLQNRVHLLLYTFPLTFGHLDVIERASSIFPRVVVGVAKSEAKSPLFSLDERIDLVRTSTAHLPGIEVKSFSGLLVDFAELFDLQNQSSNNLE